MSSSREITEVPQDGAGFDGFLDALVEAEAPSLSFRYGPPDDQPRVEGSENLTSGVIYTVWAPNSPEYALAAIIDEVDDKVQVVPVAFAISDPLGWEVRVPSSSLGFEANASVWAFGSILPEQCVEPIGTLAPEQLESVRSVLSQLVDDSIEIDYTAPPGSHSWRHMVHLTEKLIPYFRPAALLRHQDELGGVLNRALPFSGLTVHEAAEQAGVTEATWKAFQNQQINPAANIPVTFLAKILKEVGLFASDTLTNLARSSVLHHPASSCIQPLPSMARRRRSVRPREKSTGNPDAADAFATKLNSELRS